MTKFESKIGKINTNEEQVYNFLTDFRNFRNLIPLDKVKNFEATEENCSFSIEGIGSTGMRIIEKEPFKLIKITGQEGSRFNFFFWIQLKQVAENDTRVKLTLKAELNPMIKMVASKPLQNFLDTLVDRLGSFDFSRST